MKITKDLGTFDSAHILPNHTGKCRRLHGHTYRVVVTVEGNLDRRSGSPTEGMVEDFSILKEIYNHRIKDLLDHTLILGTEPVRFIRTMLFQSTDTFLNPDVEYNTTTESAQRFLDSQFGRVVTLPIPTTTAENLAQWMAQQFIEEFRDRGIGCRLAELQVYETPTSYASWVPSDRVYDEKF